MAKKKKQSTPAVEENLEQTENLQESKNLSETEESYFEEEVPVEEEFNPEILGETTTEPEKSEIDIIKEKERALRKR
jgi:hypothetical protein